MSAVWRVQRGFWHPIFIQPLPLGLELFMKSRRRSDAERAREKIQSDALPSRQAHSSALVPHALSVLRASFGVTPGAPLEDPGEPNPEERRSTLRHFACTGATSLFAEPGPFGFVESCMPTFCTAHDVGAERRRAAVQVPTADRAVF